MLNNENQQAIDALKDVAMAGITEQRRARRWSIFFKIMTLLLAAFFILSLLGAAFSKNKRFSSAKSYTAVVDVQGPIMQGAKASADKIIPSLQDAFKDPRAKGVMIRCNSPGGSPVQSAYVFDEIRRLRLKHPEKKVVAVASDVCASGGYFIIAAAEEIYADKSSIVGSIGVRMQNFGLVELMKKVGVENRELTAGENKAILDPFSPRNPEHEAFIKKQLENTHRHFIRAVKAGRGERIKSDNPDIFSGLFWTGEDAKELGLIDGYGSPASVARDIIKAEKMVDFNPKEDFIERLSRQISVALINLSTSKLF